MWALLAAVIAMAFWIANLVRGMNDRFDQIEHALDLILDLLKNQSIGNTSG